MRLPRRNRSDRWFFGLLIFGAVAVGAYFLLYASPSGLLHAEFRERLDRCSSKNLFDVTVRYNSPIERDELVFDLQGTHSGARRVDIIHLVYQFAYEARDLTWRILILAAKGDEVYRMARSGLDPLAQEYKTGNPVYSIRKWPSHLRTPSGAQAFSEWEGGILGLLKEMEDVSKAVDRWIERLSR